MAYRNTPYHVNLTGGYSGTYSPGGAVWYVGDSTWVSATGVGASDNNDGKSPDTPFATIQKGLDAATASRGDVVALLPGSWTITSALTMVKAGVTLCAAHGNLPYRKGNATIVCATNSVKMLTIDAAGCIVDGITFDANASTNANPLIDIGATTAGTGSVVRNCVIDMEAAGTTTDGIAITLGNYCVIENNLITDCDQDGITCADAVLCGIVRNNIIVDTVAGSSMRYGISAGGDNMVVSGNIITASTSAGACIYVNGVQDLVVNNRLWARAANTICVSVAASGTIGSMGNWMGCITDAGNHISFGTDNTSPSAYADLGAVTNTNPTAVTFVDAIAE